MADSRTALKATGRLTGPIVAKRREEVEPRGGVRLPIAWHEESDGASGARGRPAAGPLAAAGDEVAIRTLGSAPLLLAISRSAGTDVIALLRAVLRADRHVYVLAEVEDAQRRLAAEIASVPGARVLVRTATDVPFSAIVSASRAAGLLWLGSPTKGAAGWRLQLAKAQCESLFRVLNHIFWHQAVLEGWQGPSGLELKAIVGDPPFDAHLPGASAPISLAQGPAKLSPDAPWTIWHEPGGIAPIGTTRKGLLVVPPSGEGATPLAAWVASGADVVWSDLGLPPFAVAENGGTLLAGFGPRTLVIRLEPDQGRALASLALEAARTAAWRLKRDVPLSDVGGQVWLPGEKEPVAAEESVARDCGSVPALSLRQFADVKPTDASRPKVPALAKAVHWSWTVEPPRAPPDARPDAIHATWEALDRDFERRIAGLRESLKAYDERQGRVRSAFAALAGALLGFDSDRRTLGSEIDASAKVVPSKAGPAVAREALAKVAELEERVHGLVRDLERTEAEEKARLERERVRREWEEKREAARKRDPVVQARLEELAGLKRAREKELADTSNLPDKKERRAKSASLEADLERFGKEISALKREATEIDELSEQAGPPGAAGPGATPSSTAAPKGTAGKGVSGFIPQPAARKAESVPDEALPSVGRLVRAKAGRFLTIELWEHLEQAEVEAQRLGADLVAGPAKGKEGK